MTSDEFRQLCRDHDLTFEYSDDSRAYNQGRDQLARIREAAKQLPPGEAATIWNEVVRTKLKPEHVEAYLWEAR